MQYECLLQGIKFYFQFISKFGHGLKKIPGRTHLGSFFLKNLICLIFKLNVNFVETQNEFQL